MNKFSLTNEKVKNKISSLIDGLIESPEFSLKNEEVPEDFNSGNDLPASERVPDPLLTEESSYGAPMIVDGEEIYNPEYVYDVDLPIYHTPERSGEGYAPTQKAQPDFPTGYAPNQPQKVEDTSENTCVRVSNEEDPQILIVEEIPENKKLFDNIDEIILEDPMLKQITPADSTYFPMAVKNESFSKKN